MDVWKVKHDNAYLMPKDPEYFIRRKIPSDDDLVSEIRIPRGVYVDPDFSFIVNVYEESPSQCFYDVTVFNFKRSDKEKMVQLLANMSLSHHILEVSHNCEYKRELGVLVKVYKSGDFSTNITDKTIEAMVKILDREYD